LSVARLGGLLCRETADEKQRFNDGVVRDDDLVGDKACVALGELALHHNIGVLRNSFDGLWTSEVHGRPRESVHLVRMLAAELPYAVNGASAQTRPNQQPR